MNSIQLLASKITKEPIGTHKIFNIGNSSPISVKKYAELIAKNLNKELIIENKPLPTNELESTHSDTKKLQTYIDYKPHCTIEDGVQEMVDWFKEIHYE